MILQIPEKDNTIPLKNYTFVPSEFESHTPFRAGVSSGLHTCFLNQPCGCDPNKLKAFNTYKYRKYHTLPDGSVSAVLLDRTVTDINREGKVCTVSFKVRNYRCETFARMDPEKRRAQGVQLYHAHLPFFVPKYGKYSYRFILTVLDEYSRHAVSVRALCEKWGIAVSTLYRWKKDFSVQSRRIFSILLPSPPDFLRGDGVTPERTALATPHLVYGFPGVTGSVTLLEHRRWERLHSDAS